MYSSTFYLFPHLFPFLNFMLFFIFTFHLAFLFSFTFFSTLFVCSEPYFPLNHTFHFIFSSFPLFPSLFSSYFPSFSFLPFHNTLSPLPHSHSSPMTLPIFSCSDSHFTFHHLPWSRQVSKYPLGEEVLLTVGITRLKEEEEEEETRRHGKGGCR